MRAIITITENEAYAIESAISELESLMEGTLDEDYSKGTAKIVNALYRVLKKTKAYKNDKKNQTTKS